MKFGQQLQRSYKDVMREIRTWPELPLQLRPDLRQPFRVIKSDLDWPSSVKHWNIQPGCCDTDMAVSDFEIQSKCIKGCLFLTQKFEYTKQSAHFKKYFLVRRLPSRMTKCIYKEYIINKKNFDYSLKVNLETNLTIIVGFQKLIIIYNFLCVKN